MHENPYAPPTATVADVTPLDELEAEPPFFAVSVVKLVLMCLCTFTIYEAYWFYRHWKQVERRERAGLSPLLRGIFAPIFCYALFARMRDYNDAGGASSGLNLSAAHAGGRVIARTLPVPLLAAGCIIGNFLFRLPGAFSLLGFLTVASLVPVQIFANSLNAAVSPAHNRNARLTLWNWLIVVPGTLFLLLAVAGLFLVPDGE
jgi:hypothetical protein